MLISSQSVVTSSAACRQRIDGYQIGRHTIDGMDFSDGTDRLISKQKKKRKKKVGGQNLKKDSQALVILASSLSYSVNGDGTIQDSLL